MKSTCIVDFAGNYNTPGFWADYVHDEQVVYFGGAWSRYEPIFWPTAPHEDEIYAYCKRVTMHHIMGRA